MSVETSVPARSKQLLATCGLMIATAMQAADGTIANVALPRLEQDLGGGVELGAWVMTSYLCATAVIAPLTGWLRRRYGARRLFPGAIIAFIGASLLCSLAPNGLAVILARILQGAGAGVMLPLAQAILLDIYPKEQHGRMLAVWGAALMLGPVVGPAIGGVITDLASWRWVFVINFPLGVLAIWGIRSVQSPVEPTDNPAMDGVGVLSLVTAVAALQLCLERGVGRSWLDSPEFAGEGAIAMIAFTALGLRARRSGFTVFRPDLFKNVNFSAAAGFNFMTSGVLFVTVVFLPALGQVSLGYDATLAGFSIVPRAILMMLTILLIGRLIGRVDYRILLASGWLLMSAGLALLSNIPRDDGVWWIVVGSAIQAVGAGMLFTPLSTLAFSTLDPDSRTDAAGLYSLLRQLGFASGVALMTAILRARIETRLLHLPPAFAHPAQALPIPLVNGITLRAYCDCFRMMAIASLIITPGILLFRVATLGRTEKHSA